MKLARAFVTALVIISALPYLYFVLSQRQTAAFEVYFIAMCMFLLSAFLLYFGMAAHTRLNKMTFKLLLMCAVLNIFVLCYALFEAYDKIELPHGSVLLQSLLPPKE